MGLIHRVGNLWEADVALDAKYVKRDVNESIPNLWDFIAGLKERNRATKIGEWQSPIYNAANFFGDPPMVWTVEAGDIDSYSYTLVGKTMTLSFRLELTSISGTPTNALRIVIPGNFTSARGLIMPCIYNDAGAGLTLGFIAVSTGATSIAAFKNTFGNWSLSSNNTSVIGQLTFEIQ